jgi:trehalose/maltose transport system substrate-binding protein
LAWSAESGHTVTVVRGPEQSNQRYLEYLDLLSRGDRSVDILPIDIIWPSALADQLVDLSGYVPAGVISQHFSAILVNNTVAGRLVAMPWFTDAGMLFYREDLLAKYGIEVPQTRSELADAAVDSGRRARRGERRLLGPRVPGSGVRGPDLQRAGVDQRCRRRPDRR